MKKNTIIILILALLIVLSALSVVASQRIDFSSWKKDVDVIKNDQNNERIIMKINDVVVAEKDYKLLELALSQAEKSYDDKDIKDELIRRAVIDSEINKYGITVSDEEVFKFNEERFALIYQDKENSVLMNEFLETNNISLEDYKKQSLEISKKALLAVRLREKLVEDYKDKNSDENNFFEAYIKEKMDEANVEFYE